MNRGAPASGEAFGCRTGRVCNFRKTTLKFGVIQSAPATEREASHG